MMEIVKDIRNELLKRKEMTFHLTESANPGYERMQKKIAEKFKLNEENIVVNQILSNFGSNLFIVNALIYDSVEHKNKYEPSKKNKQKVKV